MIVAICSLVFEYCDMTIYSRVEGDLRLYPSVIEISVWGLCLLTGTIVLLLVDDLIDPVNPDLAVFFVLHGFVA